MIKVITIAIMLIVFLVATSALNTHLVYAQPICFGLEATISGTPDDDLINGTPGPDVIVGFAGNDIIRGLEGDDVICGGLGNDLIIGGAGNDQLFGGRGADILRGKTGNVLLNGGRVNNFLDGGLGTDECNRQIGRVTYTNCEPTGGHSCDFTPEHTGIYYTKSDCADLADAFDCADFSWELKHDNTGLCKVFDCIGCLCDAYHAIPDFAEDCSIHYNNCFNLFRDPFQLCEAFVCLPQLPCGSFNGTL